MATDRESTQTQSRLESLALPVLFVAGILLYLPGLGSYGPLDPTDSFFIEGGRELFETQQYLLPMFNYQIWLDKPILYFWLVVACYKLLGVSAFAGRLASALSAIATAVVILQGGRANLGVKQAFVAACIFLTFPLVSVIGHESLTDMTLTFLMTASLLGFFNYLQRPRFFVIVLAYLALGFAFLCKGPVAVVIVAAIVLLYFCFISDFAVKNVPFLRVIWRQTLKLRPFLGLAIMLAVNLPWYTAAAVATKGEFLYTFFITQNFGRMAGKINHVEPFWYYFPVILGGLFPLNLLLFSRWHAFRTAVKNRKINGRAEAMVFFSLVWAFLVLLLFGSIKTKLATYILPAMPPLAILTAHNLFVWIKIGKVKNLAPGALLFAIAGLAGLIVPSAIKASWVTVLLSEQRLLLILMLLTGVAYFLLLVKNKAIAAFSLLLASAAVGVGICVPVGHRVFYNEVHRPFEAMIERVIQDKALIATVVTEEPSISYFLHRHIDVLNTPHDAKEYLATKLLNGRRAAHYLIVPQKCLKDMEWFPAGAIELAKIRKWTLFKLNETVN